MMMECVDDGMDALGDALSNLSVKVPASISFGRGGRGRGGEAQLDCDNLLEGARRGGWAWEGLRGFVEVQSWKQLILNLHLIRRSS